MDRILILGAGGFAREVHDVIIALPHLTFEGFIDPAPDLDLLSARQTISLGGDEALTTFAGFGYLVGVGSPRLRRRLASKADMAGLLAAQAVHPAATFGMANELGAGLVACAGVRVTTNVRIGKHVHLNLNSTVGHDTVIGDFVTINPGVSVSGNVTLGSDVTIGTGASVIDGIAIGAGSTIGAGAVVIRDIPAGVTAVGVPARPL